MLLDHYAGLCFYNILGIFIMSNFFHNFINLSKNISYIDCSKILPYAGLLDENVRLYLQLAR